MNIFNLRKKKKYQEDGNTWILVGVLLEQSGKHEKAIEAFDKALKINPLNVAAWTNKGASLTDLGRYLEAIECFDAVLEINSKNKAAWNNKGLAFARLKRYKEAIKCYDEALKINPKDHVADSASATNKKLLLEKLKKERKNG